MQISIVPALQLAFCSETWGLSQLRLAVKPGTFHRRIPLLSYFPQCPYLIDNYFCHGVNELMT